MKQPQAALVFAALLAAAGAASAFQERAVHSLLEARHRNVVIQEWDSSCGAASLATLLKFQFGDAVTERGIALGMLRGIDPDRIRMRGGFSLLDMKRYAESRGYVAEGYAELTPGQLMRLAPAIVPLRSHGGDHFVVFRGVVNGQAVLADPAFGNRSMPFAAFDSKWKDRLGFVVKVAGKNANRLHASRRDLLRVEDEAARQAMADKLPRPLGDAQLALAFAIDAPRAPTPGPLVPIASPDNPNARPPATGFPPSQALAPPSSLAPAPTPVAAPALPGVPPSPSPTAPIATPIIGIAPAPSSPPGTVGISAPLLPPVSVMSPLPLPGATITISTPPIPSPLGR